MRPVDIFHIGPQKSAHTWVYSCLRQHPEIACTNEDCVYYFDIFYSRGRGWYEKCFSGAEEHQMLCDTTCTYIRSPWAPGRIAQENPDAKIILCMRNPILRAFSHYWQEKKRNMTNYNFSGVLTNYDLFSSWLEPGFYAEHIERYLEHFPRGQILCQRFDDLERDPTGFLQEILTFIGADRDFRPALAQRKVNEASQLVRPFSLAMNKTRRWLQRIGLKRLLPKSGRLYEILSGRAEYVRGIPPELRLELQEIVEPEIERLEALLGVDLQVWREPTLHGSSVPPERR